MRKPFTLIAALLLAVIALGQATRAFLSIDVAIDTFHVPVLWSWVAAAVAGLISIMLFREAQT